MAPTSSAVRESAGTVRIVARIRDALRLLGVLVTVVTSRRLVRPRGDEATRSLPGDELVADAKIRWNHAITIRARPADVWPWLVQMGCRRAGWYSYDGLDNGGGRSAEWIVPELQQVQVGDIFPMTPKAKDRFVVRIVEKVVWHPLDFGMQRRQLLNLKRLVEDTP